MGRWDDEGSPENGRSPKIADQAKSEISIN